MSEAGLTQMLPVSIPSESLLVSGLKDMQEHWAEGRNTQNSSDNHKVVPGIFQETPGIFSDFKGQPLFLMKTLG